MVEGLRDRARRQKTGERADDEGHREPMTVAPEQPAPLHEPHRDGHEEEGEMPRQEARPVLDPPLLDQADRQQEEKDQHPQDVPGKGDSEPRDHPVAGAAHQPQAEDLGGEDADPRERPSQELRSHLDRRPPGVHASPFWGAGRSGSTRLATSALDGVRLPAHDRASPHPKAGRCSSRIRRPSTRRSCSLS